MSRNSFQEIGRSPCPASRSVEIKRLVLKSLVLSPFYFSLSLPERRNLVNRLCAAHLRT